MRLFLTIIIVYLAISVFLAAKRIIARWKYEEYLNTVPAGDLWLHCPKTPLLDWFTTLFFPAHFIIITWVHLAQTINSRRL